MTRTRAERRLLSLTALAPIALIPTLKGRIPWQTKLDLGWAVALPH